MYSIHRYTKYYSHTNTRRKKSIYRSIFFSRYKISVPDHDARIGSRVPRPDSYCLSLAQGYRVSLVTQTHGGYKRVTLP